MAERIVRIISECVMASPLPYCEGNKGRAFLHSQSGIDIDEGVTPGTRIPFEDEPDLMDHILFSSRLHKYFPAGISDIFHFESTLGQNIPAAIQVFSCPSLLSSF